MRILSNIFKAFERHVDSVCNTVEIVFRCFWGMPWYLKYLTITTLFVITVPIIYTIKPLIFIDKPFASQFFEWFALNNILFMLHVAAAIPAIIFGPFMIDAGTRKNYLAAHRRLGTWYVMGCMFSAVTVIPLAIANTPGTPAPYGFTTMAIVWFIVTFFAYTSARNKDFIAHRRWILRSYAMTYAFVNVNFTYKVLPVYDFVDTHGAKVMQSMVSWQFNLLVVEIFLLLTTFKGRFIGWGNLRHHLHIFSPEDKFYLSWKKV